MTQDISLYRTQDVSWQANWNCKKILHC